MFDGLETDGLKLVGTLMITDEVEGRRYVQTTPRRFL
jgi:hypothetical protein